MDSFNPLSCFYIITELQICIYFCNYVHKTGKYFLSFEPYIIRSGGAVGYRATASRAEGWGVRIPPTTNQSL